MSERFELTKINPTVNLSDTVYFIIDYENPNKEIRTLKDCIDLLNEQQELIEELHTSDNMGWGRAEKFEKELKQKKIYIKRLEYKVQKFKEMNGEQQATIRKLQDLCGKSDGENMKLRIENKRLQELNDDKGKRIISLIRTNKTLKEENKQLKNKLNKGL